MKNGISIDTMINLYAYCADFDKDHNKVRIVIERRYETAVREHKTKMVYDEYMSTMLAMLRSDEEIKS